MEDHCYALAQAAYLRNAATSASQPDSVEALCQAAKRFLRFWEVHSSFHLPMEEEVMLPFFARYVHLDQEPFIQIMRDHVLLRRDAERLREQMNVNNFRPEPTTLLALATRLERHTFFEERQVFPLIERVMPDAVLMQMGENLAAFQDAQSTLVRLIHPSTFQLASVLESEALCS